MFPWLLSVNLVKMHAAEFFCRGLKVRVRDTNKDKDLWSEDKDKDL